MVTHFVGRRDQLSQLAALHAAAVAGAPQFALVVAPGGAGKSALVAQFAATRPTRAVRATGDEGEVSLSFGVLDQLLISLDGAAPADHTAPAVYTAAAERDPFAAGMQLLQRIRLETAAEPLLMVLDDIHLADRLSLTALTFALRRLNSERVLVIIAIRASGLAQLSPGLRRLLDANSTRIELPGLSTAEVRALAVVSGLGPLTERAANRVREHTAGSPLHLRALFADLTAAQLESTGRALPAPRSLAMLVLAALAQRSESARRLAQAAAVLGMRPPLDQAAWLADVRDVLPAIDELRRANIASLLDDGLERRIVFDHLLVRSAIYDDLGAVARANLHRRAAARSTGVEALRHRVEAAIGPDDILVHDLRAAAARARGERRWAAAAAHLFNAMRFAAPGRVRDRVLIEAVEMQLSAGDPAAARAHQAEIALLPPTVHRLQVQCRIAWLTADHATAYEFAQRAWALAAADDVGSRQEVAATLSQMCLMQNDGGSAGQWAELALGLGPLEQAAEDAVRATGALGYAVSGDVGRGLRLIEGASWPVGDGPHTQSLAARGMMRLWRDDLAGALADLRTASAGAIAEPLSEAAPYQLVALAYLVETEYRVGLWDAADRHSQQALALVEDTGQTWLRPLTNAAATFVPAGRGRWEEAQRHVEQAQRAAAETKDPQSVWYAQNAAVHLAGCRGDSEQVLRVSARLLAEDNGRDREPGVFSWSLNHLNALVTAGQLERADERLATLTELAAQSSSRMRLASLNGVRARIAMARRDHTGARAAFLDALALADQVNSPIQQGMLHLFYGQFLRRRGERRSAVQQLTIARDILVGLGAAPFIAICDSELAAAGNPAAAGGTEVRGDHGLTPQELAVARLVKAGLTNQQIATELTLSVKTVGYHLGHVYAKVGVKSRVELATTLDLLGAPAAGERKPGVRPRRAQDVGS